MSQIESITFFFTDLDEIENIDDTNIDVRVKLNNSHQYVVVVATQQNLLTLMNYEKVIFYLLAIQ